eukprot:UN03272
MINDFSSVTRLCLTPRSTERNKIWMSDADESLSNARFTREKSVRDLKQFDKEFGDDLNNESDYSGEELILPISLANLDLSNGNDTPRSFGSAEEYIDQENSKTKLKNVEKADYTTDDLEFSRHESTLVQLIEESDHDEDDELSYGKSPRFLDDLQSEQRQQVIKDLQT